MNQSLPDYNCSLEEDAGKKRTHSHSRKRKRVLPCRLEESISAMEGRFAFLVENQMDQEETLQQERLQAEREQAQKQEDLFLKVINILTPDAKYSLGW